MAKKPLSPEELFAQDVIERFVSKLSLADNGCIEWTGSLSPDGYGQLSIGDREHQQKIRAHRYAYQLTYGMHVLPTGLNVCHHCDNPACVHPMHLFGGTHQDNMNDMVSKGRSAISFGNAKLTQEQADEIYGSKKTLKEIMNEYDISKSTASDIRSGKTWR